MLKICFFLLALLPGATLLRAQTPIPVFPLHTDGYLCFRIPALLALPDGALIAFAEGRKYNCYDFGDVDIVCKKSRDGGKTWGPLRLLVDNDSLQAGNCAPVLDRLDPRFPNGRIFLFYNTGTASEQEVGQGRGLREVWYITSTDGGKTWSAPVNITAQTHRPGSPPYRHSADWRGYANTPGHAIQLEEGPHRGRIYVAANHTEGPPKPAWGNCFSHGFYSDDHGDSFQLSESVPVPGSNEATAAELPNGGLLLNCRNQAGQPRRRIQAFSSDGGTSWDSCGYHPALIEPVCQGTLLRFAAGKRHWLLFANPGSEKVRENLTLRRSTDSGRTWSEARIIVPGPAAYCDLAQLGRRHIGVLYEKGSDGGIFFVRERISSHFPCIHVF